jgi:hypothetical protein
VTMTEDERDSVSADVASPRGGTFLALAGTLLVAAEFVWLTISSAKVIDQGGDPWQTGDWLINLAAGPVRRGLFGELLFRLTDSPNVLWLTFGVQIALLGSLSALTLVLFWRSPRTAAWFMLTFSPAFLLFASLSPEGALRKELFGLAAFALLAVCVRFRWPPATLAGVVALFALGSMAHELTALMLPAFAYLIVWGRRQGRWSRGTTRVTVVVMAATAVAAVAWALLFPATAAETSKICSSWTAAGLDRELCSGALRFHSRSLSESLQLTKGMFPAYLSLVPLAVLSLVPFIVLRAPRRIWWLLGTTFLALVPLFFVAIDYGRWIYVGVALTSLVCLATWTQGDIEARNVPAWVAILFVALWSLPYAGPQTTESLVMQVLSSPIERMVGTPSDGPTFRP